MSGAEHVTAATRTVDANSDGYPTNTALLLIDPYNDFLSEGGKFWPRVEEVAKEVRLLENLRAITAAVRKAGIQTFIVPHRRWEPGGLLANTCVECTSRFAAELGYHVTLVKDATAAFGQDGMHAAHQLNGPTFAHRILTTAELIAELP